MHHLQKNTGEGVQVWLTRNPVRIPVLPAPTLSGRGARRGGPRRISPRFLDLFLSACLVHLGRGVPRACQNARTCPQSSSVGSGFKTYEALGRFSTASSLRIFPSRNTITRFSNFATSSAWLTITIAKPS